MLSAPRVLMSMSWFILDPKKSFTRAKARRRQTETCVCHRYISRIELSHTLHTWLTTGLWICYTRLWNALHTRLITGISIWYNNLSYTLHIWLTTGLSIWCLSVEAYARETIRLGAKGVVEQCAPTDHSRHCTTLQHTATHPGVTAQCAPRLHNSGRNNLLFTKFTMSSDWDMTCEKDAIIQYA